MKKPTLLPVMVLFALLSFSCSTDSMDETSESINTNLTIPETKIIEIILFIGFLILPNG